MSANAKRRRRAPLGDVPRNTWRSNLEGRCKRMKVANLSPPGGSKLANLFELEEELEWDGAP